MSSSSHPEDNGGDTAPPGRPASSAPIEMPGRRAVPAPDGHHNTSWLRIENGRGSGGNASDREMRVGTPDQALTDHLDKVREWGGRCVCALTVK